MQAIKDIVSTVLIRLQNPEALQRTQLISQWPAIAGPRLAPHTKPALGREGKLWVWVDQSALAFELNQKYRPSLLKRTQAVLGEEAVKSVHVRVGQLR